VVGKGAAYAQADADIRTLIEKTGIPYLPMSMAKGLLPDTHEQSAAAARSYVLPAGGRGDADRARLQLAADRTERARHGAARAQDVGRQKFIQIDISPQEADSKLRIDAPWLATSARAYPRCCERWVRLGRNRRRSG
jgi:oxalyl-CoA decarboxylase